jgi:hypothetical protein
LLAADAEHYADKITFLIEWIPNNQGSSGDNQIRATIECNAPEKFKAGYLVSGGPGCSLTADVILSIMKYVDCPYCKKQADTPPFMVGLREVITE